MIEKMIIISGIGRSGTTWMQHWLLEHPMTYGGQNESRIFTAMSELMRNNRLDPWMSREERYALAGVFIYSFFDKTFQKERRPYLIEKTPHNWRWWNIISQMIGPMSEVYFIHVYRDGRNVIESVKRQRWKNAPPLKEYALNWIQLMNKMMSDKFPSNVISIKYEDLVANPSCSKEITEFCDIEHHHDIQPFEKMVSNSRDDGLHFSRWKTVTDPELLDYFAQMDETLVKLGYES